MTFADALPGIVPNTTYLYRVTALAANGEAGQHTVTWTAPSPVVLHWLSAAATAGSVTLKWRYEPPTANAPAVPTGYKITAPYGLNRGYIYPCGALAGCTMVVTAVPPGTHTFSVAALWSLSTTGSVGQASAPPGPTLATVRADTVVTVP